MRNTIGISQCYDDAFVDGTAVEVAVHNGGAHPALYMVGEDIQDGTTLIVPLDPQGHPRGPRWYLADHTVMDAVEELQTLTDCGDCSGTGVVERIGRDLADVSDEDCDRCDGRGWHR